MKPIILEPKNAFQKDIPNKIKPIKTFRELLLSKVNIYPDPAIRRAGMASKPLSMR